MNRDYYKNLLLKRKAYYKLLRKFNADSKLEYIKFKITMNV